IARIAPERGGAELITAVGPLLGAQIGEFLRLRGRWSSHPKYGRQFEVASYATVLPATAAGIQKYLGSGLIKGIGPVMAERMVAHFGVDIMHVIDDDPGRLVEVDGLGPKRTAMIAAAWAEQKAIKEVMIFLQGVGVSTSLAVRIYKKYGDASVSVVRDEPYRLAADVQGIRPPMPSPPPPASRPTAPSGSRPAWPAPCPRPPTTATATCPPPT